MINKYEILKTLRKQFPTLMAEHSLAVGEYMEKLKTSDDKFVLEATTKYLINLKSNKK